MGPAGLLAACMAARTTQLRGGVAEEAAEPPGHTVHPALAPLFPSLTALHGLP